MSRPTPNQKGVQQGRENRDKIVQALIDYIGEHGHSPSRPKLAAATGLALKTVEQHVRVLVAEGVLEEPNKNRNIPSLRLKE